MKRLTMLILAVCILLTGCMLPENESAPETTAPSEPTSQSESVPQTETIPQTEAAQSRKIHPLSDITMEDLTDAILAVSIAEGAVYADDKGTVYMDLKIYAYDRYDMVDIASLQVGDILVRHSGETEVISKEKNELGTLFINGGFDNDGFDLGTDDSGIFYEVGFNDSRNWYESGEATIAVSADFLCTDSSDPDLGEVTFTASSFINGEVANFDFTPYNTTIRIEGGEIVEMIRHYVP